MEMDIFIGIFPDDSGQVGFDLPPAVLARLASVPVAVVFDVYPIEAVDAVDDAAERKPRKVGIGSRARRARHTRSALTSEFAPPAGFEPALTV